MIQHLTSALAQRLVRVIELSTLALPALATAGCGGNVVVDGGGGSSGSASNSSSTGGPTTPCIVGPHCTPDGPDPGPQQTLCFTPTVGQPCPDAADAASSLPPSCAEVMSVEAVCSGGAAGMCCYNVTAECICVGRPFLVSGVSRTAAAVPREHRGWQGDEVPDARDLPRATRDALAAAFTADALGEHASVASFGRFALELMAVGAPADLVAAAHRAALDEVRHAQIAFGLAGGFGGAPLGPGALALGEVSLRTDLTSFARALAAEGCVHETLAALVAAARARAATDPRVAGLLASIAADEARHAELAWKALAWVLGVGGEEVAEAVFAAFAEAGRAVPAAPGAPAASIHLEAFGVLDAGTTRALVAAGVAEVIAPCARSLRHAATAPRPSPSADLAPARIG